MVAVVGFSGTQEGGTDAQVVTLNKLLRRFQPNKAHHGICIGADLQFHRAVRKLLPDTTIYGHPPIVKTKQARCRVDVLLPAKEYKARNRDIVLASPTMIIMPKEFNEVIRSGTWMTYRLARLHNRRIYIIQPDGKVVRE